MGVVAYDRLELIKDVYETFLEGTETFEGNIAVGLAYLMGEIAKEGSFQVLEDSPYYDEFLGKMQELFPSDHEVWTYVHREKG